MKINHGGSEVFVRLEFPTPFISRQPARKYEVLVKRLPIQYVME